MLIECETCEAVVDAQVLHSYEYFDQKGRPGKYSFLKCPKCKSPFLVVKKFCEHGWDKPYRIYPPQDKRVNPSFPKPIRDSYQEALSCFKAKSFTAAAIMCRKTLEGICVEHEIKAGNLASGLKEMKEKGLIESRLFEWAEALRIAGNKAAHDVNVSISNQDAKDIIEFTDALLEYVFTFRDKFNEFIIRRQRTQTTDNTV